MKKRRYISIRVDENEIYAEDIASNGDIKDSLELCKKKLLLIRAAMPKGDWSITIEQEWIENGDFQYQLLDVETEELQEQIL